MNAGSQFLTLFIKNSRPWPALVLRCPLCEMSVGHPAAGLPAVSQHGAAHALAGPTAEPHVRAHTGYQRSAYLRCSRALRLTRLFDHHVKEIPMAQQNDQQQQQQNNPQQQNPNQQNPGQQQQDNPQHKQPGQNQPGQQQPNQPR